MSIHPNAHNLIRQAWPKRTGRAKRRRDTGPHPTVIILVKARANGRCERCAAPIVTTGEVHHRIPRGMGGSRDPRINRASNLVAICRTCHSWVERYRNAAREQGWLVLRAADPGDVPIESRLHGRVLLADDGTVHPAGGTST